MYKTHKSLTKIYINSSLDFCPTVEDIRKNSIIKTLN